MSSDITRKEFLRNATFGVAGITGALALGGCSTSAPESPNAGGRAYSFVPGTYLGRADGRSDDIVVRVSVDEHSMQDIEVMRHDESGIISTTPISRIPEEILKYQSLSIDAVSHATMTSIGIQSAVANAISQAGVDASELYVDYEKVLVEEPDVSNVNICVVGGGFAGLAATVRAAQLGVPVVVFEHAAHIGGSGLFGEGLSFGCDTTMQKEAGIVDSPEIWYQEYMERLPEGAEQTWDENFVKMLMAESGKTIDWLEQYVGVNYGNRTVSRGLHNWTGTPREYRLLNGGYGYVGPMYAKVQEGVEAGLITLLTEHDVTNFLMDDSGRVSGVTAVDRYGTSRDYEFEYVLLTVGDFTHNYNLLDQHYGDILSAAPNTSTGNFYDILIDMGVQFSGMEFSLASAGSISEGTRNARYVADTRYPGTIWVNSSGNRMCDESTSSATQVCFDQDGQLFYIILPENNYVEGRGIISKYSFLETPFTPYTSYNKLRELAKNGKGVYEADTVAELAELMGVDAVNLESTINKVNSGVDEEYGRADLPQIDAHLYAIKIMCATAITNSQAVINNDFQYVTVDGTTIDGLYGAGAIIGFQLPPSTELHGGEGLGGYPNQGRICMQLIIAQMTGEDTSL